ncbi:MAG: hypothetical protein K2Q06_00340, partial [Parvularculaceae bacterium]|nr:hypothetical protein [Parvularculaceae bacterium]
GAHKADIVVADAGDPASVAMLAGKARVIATTVGPYQLYGSPLVAACAAAGTDYVDLCGEPAWMRQMIDAHDVEAKKSGARIVFSCGFDSIPFDLGVLFLQNEARRHFDAPCVEVKTRVRAMRGKFSGGTAASFKATMAAAFKDPKVIEMLKSPFGLTPGFEGPRQPSISKPMEEDGVWMAPFIMAPINTKNVHRSNMLLGFPYGRDFLYGEMMMAGPGARGEQAAQMIAAADASLMGEDAPKPGEGPTKEERDAGHYDILFIGRTADGRTIKASVKGDKDPGYGSTSKMLTEAALCLLKEKRGPGGVFTPAAAMGAPLIGRLADAGLVFALED